MGSPVSLAAAGIDKATEGHVDIERTAVEATDGCCHGLVGIAGGEVAPAALTRVSRDEFGALFRDDQAQKV